MPDNWFTIHRSALFPAFQHVSRAIEGKSDIPILSHVLVTAEADTLRLRGTNFDLQIEAECELMSIEETQAFALPASRLGDILRQLPESAEISFTAGRTRDQVGIRAGRSVFSVPFLAASDFPEMRGRVDLAWTEIDGAGLADAISKSSYAVNKGDINRTYLTGLCLHADKAGTGMVMCGTDGLVLARIEIPGGGSPRFPKREGTNGSYPHIIIPMRAAEALNKLLDGAKATAQMGLAETVAAVRFQGVEISTKLIDGIYPLYERVVPARTEQTVVVPHGAFAAAVKRVCSVMDDSQNDGIRLKVADGTLAIDLLTGLGSFAEDAVSAEINAPNGFTIAHSAAKLEKTLQIIRAADVELMLTDAATALVLRPLGNTAETFMVQPMRPRFVAE